MNQFFFQKNNTQILIWNDKKPVVMITTKYNVKETVRINDKTLPLVISEYNLYMGGVDRFDQMIKYYSMKRKTNRWTQRFTVHILELLMHNGFVLYLKFFKGKKLSHYDFVEKIIKYFLSLVDLVAVNDENIINKKHHLPIKALKRSNCKRCYSSGNKRCTSFYKCEKCDIYLCIDPLFLFTSCTVSRNRLK